MIRKGNIQEIPVKGRSSAALGFVLVCILVALACGVVAGVLYVGPSAGIAASSRQSIGDTVTHQREAEAEIDARTANVMTVTDGFIMELVREIHDQDYRMAKAGYDANMAIAVSGDAAQSIAAVSHGWSASAQGCGMLVAVIVVVVILLKLAVRSKGTVDGQ